MNLTNQQVQTLRTRPHQANLYLSIYRPKTLFAARVATGTYSTGDNQIPYYGVITGSYTNLYEDVTFLIGTTPGGDEYGRLRSRSATSSLINFAENAINWSTNMYLTAVDQIDIVAKYPRIIADPNNATNVIFYKDYDIPYSNQNRIYGTFPNAGPHRAGFIGDPVYFSATGTYNVLDESLTYSWNFEGGTPTGSNSITPGNVQWNTPGHYKARLRVTSTSGAVDDTYRYVSRYNRPGEGASTPVAKWELQNLQGSRSEGGYTATIKVYEDLGSVQPNAVVVIFSDNTYGTTRTNLGGNAVGNSSILFVGYVMGDSIRFDYQSSTVEFTVASVSGLMKEAEGFSVSCESKASPTTWYELYEMNVPRAMYHYLRWHSTVLKTTDFQYTGDNRLVQYFDSDRGSLYDAVDSFMRDGMLGELVSDRQGKLWAEISPFGYENPMSSIPNYMPPLQKQDWMNTPTISERRNSDMSFIELGGIVYYGVSTNTFTPLISNAPSTAPLYHGKSDRKEGLILNSQAQLNQVSGNYLAYFNSKFPEISMSMNGIYTNLDIAPYERYYLVISQNDTVRNQSLQKYPYFVDSMEWRYSSVHQSLTPEVVFHQIATGTAGVTVQIPITPPDNGYSYPSLSLPPLPTFGNSNPLTPISTSVLFWDKNMGLVYTSNFDSGSPNYITVNAGLSVTQYKNINFMFVCPNGSVYVGRCDVMSNADRGTGRARNPWIARAPSIGSTFTIIEDETTLWAKYSTYPTANHAIKACSFNPLVPESVAYIMGENTTTIDLSDFDIWTGAAGSYAKGAHATRINSDQSHNGLSYGGTPAKWVYTGAKAALFSPSARWTFSSNGGTLESDGALIGGDISQYSHMRAGTLPNLFILGTSSGDIWKSADNGQTWTALGNTLLHGGDGMSIEPASGMYAMLMYDVGNKGRTTDGLSTVTGLPTLPPSTRYIFGYAGGLSKWIAAFSIIRLSTDLGGSWMNREGDYLTTINPIPAIYMVFVPGVTQTHSQQNSI